MKNKILFALFSLLFCHTLVAHPSLLFTEDEVSRIRNTFQAKSPSMENALRAFGELHLSAIVYVNEKRWALWLNKKIIHPGNVQTLQGVTLHQVTPYGVTFSWIPPDRLTPETFTLRPPQYYSASQRKVLEGGGPGH